MTIRRRWLGLGALIVSAAACGGDEGDAALDEPAGEAGQAISVAGVADQACSTTVVAGLSEQILDEGNCIAPGSYAELPSLPNLQLGGAVFPFMRQAGRDALVQALSANPGTTMFVTSMLRTPAQQYLLFRWASQNRCGIALAASPGKSNHETGLAIDVSPYGPWVGKLGGYGFSWLGSIDPVHFDYVGPGAVADKSLGVLAFQRLHNRNHPADEIAEDGIWGPTTQSRMAQAPSEGFPIGAICDTSPCSEVFDDICDSPFQTAIEWIAAQGITSGCAPDLYCPQANVTRGQMAAFLANALSLPPGPDAFDDDDDSPFESAIDAIAAAGITSGCGPGAFCPDDAVTRGQMAAFLTSALSLPPGPDAFDDDDGSPFEPSIDAIAAAGITSGCGPGAFCPDDVVTREQMAGFLFAALAN